MGPAGRLSGHVDNWEELAIGYLDGSLDPATTAAVKQHLDACPACAARMRTQEQTLTLLRGIPLEEPPAALENQVLGDIFAPPLPQPAPITRPAAAHPAPVTRSLEKPSRWEQIWRRKIRPWVPATVGVAAVLIALVSYGVLYTGADESAQFDGTTTFTYAAAEKASNEAGDLEGIDATWTTAAPGAAAVETTSGADATAGAMPTSTTSIMTEQMTVTMAAAGIADREDMITTLEDAQAPVYFAFEAMTAGSEGSGDGAGQKASTSVVEQIIAFTDLQPLDKTLSLDGPTFAAYVPYDDAEEFVDLLRSIGTTVQLGLTLSLEPPETAADIVTRLLERKKDFPGLYAKRTPPHAASDYRFATSTTARASTGTGGAMDPDSPDEAGTHVLVLIFLRK